MILKYVDIDCQMGLCHNASLTHKFTETSEMDTLYVPVVTFSVIVFLYIIFLTVKKL